MKPTAMPPNLDVHTVTIDALVVVCSSVSCKTLGGAPNGSGRRVVKILEQTVIKFGIGVTKSEANIQRGAYLLLDPSIVHVPQVYRFFTKDNTVTL